MASDSQELSHTDLRSRYERPHFEVIMPPSAHENRCDYCGRALVHARSGPRGMSVCRRWRCRHVHEDHMTAASVTGPFRQIVRRLAAEVSSDA
jgi:hypothetical protein